MIRSLLLALAAVAALCQAAAAETVILVTPPVDVAAAEQIECHVLNLGDAAAEEVWAVVVDQFGDPEAGGGGTVDPGETVMLASFLDAVQGASCRFSVEGDPARLRLFMRITEQPSGLPLLQLDAYQPPPGSGGLFVETFTGPVRHISSSGLQCRARNDASNSVSVTAQLRDQSGGLIGELTILIPPGESRTIVSSNTPVLGGYCRISFAGNPARVRGFLTMRQGASTTTRVVLPARVASESTSGLAVSPAIAGAEGDATACVVQNLHDETVDVYAELVDRFDNELASASLAVPAGHVVSVTGTTEAAAHAVCRFILPAGPPVRGFISQFPSGLFADTRVIEESETLPPFTETAPLTTYTAPFSNPGTLMQCVLLNLVFNPVPVTVALVDRSSGATVAATDILAFPGFATIALDSAAELSAQTCQFSFAAPAELVRGYAMLTNAAGTRTLLQLVAATLAPTSPPTPTPTPTGTPTPQPVATATGTPRPTFTSTMTQAPTGTRTPSDTQTPTASATRTMTGTATVTHTVASTATPTATRTSTASATSTATLAATATQTAVPTAAFTATSTVTSTAAATTTGTPTPAAADTATAAASASATVPIGSTPTPHSTAAASTTPATTPVATATADPFATATATPTHTTEPGCAGDCDADGVVTVDDVLVMVEGALGVEAVVCPSADLDGDGAITVDEIVAAIARGLGPC